MSEETCGAKFLPMEREPYPGYIGKLVDITLHGNGGRWGVYRGKNEIGELVLRPVYTTESHSVNPLYPDKERRQVTIEQEKPGFYPHQSVMCFEPVREEYVKMRVRESSQPSPEPEYQI